HPPLVYSANSTASALAGASQRAIVGSIHVAERGSLERIREAFGAYREQARQDGWEPGPDRFLIGLPTCIAATDEEARERLGPALEYHSGILCGSYNAQKREVVRSKPGYGATPVVNVPPSLSDMLAWRTLLCGSPATVVGQIRCLREELGVGIVSMQFQVG